MLEKDVFKYFQSAISFAFHWYLFYSSFMAQTHGLTGDFLSDCSQFQLLFVSWHFIMDEWSMKLSSENLLLLIFRSLLKKTLLWYTSSSQRNIAISQVSMYLWIVQKWVDTNGIHFQLLLHLTINFWFWWSNQTEIGHKNWSINFTMQRKRFFNRH